MSKILVTPIDYMGTDLTVVNAARVSFNKRSFWKQRDSTVEEYREEGWGYPHEATGNLEERDVKLIKYLAKHKHISPFGHCFASFHVKAPIFVARQLVKHKFLRWNEVSRRYVDDEPEFFIPESWRAKAENVKQGSGDDCEKQGFPTACRQEIEELALDVYGDLLFHGVCPEQARMLLPQSVMTEWHWSGSLDAFADMCRLRLDPHTQYESQLVARQVDACMSERFPISWNALINA